MVASTSFSPGAEIAGVVKDVGMDVSDIAIGDRVFAFIRSG